MGIRWDCDMLIGLTLTIAQLSHHTLTIFETPWPFGQNGSSIELCRSRPSSAHVLAEPCFVKAKSGCTLLPVDMAFLSWCACAFVSTRC